jgi:hypothetical protein
VAFDGPRKGHRLAPVPTLTATWGEWLDAYPNAVAYHMFDKYAPVELPREANAESVNSRGKTDPRLPADELVFGVRVGDKTKAYPLSRIRTADVYRDALGGEKLVLFQSVGTVAAVAAYRPVASQPRKFKAPRPDKDGVSPPDAGVPVSGKEEPPVKVDLTMDWHGYAVDFPQTGTLWDQAGRGTSGKLKGWTLEPVDGVVCKWFAWAAEYPDTEIYAGKPAADLPKPEAKKEEKIREVAGAAEFLRLLPKPFATLKAIDPKNRTVMLLVEGETVAKVWPVEPDAEVKVSGWWGRLEQFTPGDRVWAWLKLDRNKNPVSVAMLADEPSEQDTHTYGLTVEAASADSLTVKPAKKPARTLKLAQPAPAGVKVGGKVFVQSAGAGAKLVLDEAGFENHRALQKAWLRAAWEADGLPGTVSFLHVFSGEVDLMLDHEAQRWGRSLKYGDTVHLQADPPIKAAVRSVTPWRERTQVRLVVGELQGADLKPGQRVCLKMTPPPAEVGAGLYPPDIDHPRKTADERVGWFLANIYCVCKVTGDVCTGHFYTLASCNPNGCASPNQTKKQVAELIDRGLTDRQIYDLLLKERGPLMTRPHLLP